MVRGHRGTRRRGRDAGRELQDRRHRGEPYEAEPHGTHHRPHDAVGSDPDDVARTVVFALEQPAHVVISQLVVVPSAQR